MMRAASNARIDKLDARTFDDLLSSQNPFGSPNPTFDLRGVQFISPAGMTQLAAACHSLATSTQNPAIILDDMSVYGYLHRAGFVEVVEEVADFSPRPTRWVTAAYSTMRGTNKMLIEVTAIESASSLSLLLDRIVPVLQSRLKYKKTEALDIGIAISEVAQNSYHHNNHSCGFLAMQVYNGRDGRFLEIGVSDFGLGLAATLRRNANNPTVATDFDAIRVSIQPGTSEHDDDPTRGTGLFRLLELTAKHQGSVQFRSGSAKIRYRADKREAWAFPVPAMPGVHIALSLPTKAGA